MATDSERIDALERAVEGILKLLNYAPVGIDYHNAVEALATSYSPASGNAVKGHRDRGGRP